MRPKQKTNTFSTYKYVFASTNTFFELKSAEYKIFTTLGFPGTVYSEARRAVGITVSRSRGSPFGTCDSWASFANQGTVAGLCDGIAFEYI